MMTIRIEPDMEPRVVDLPVRTIERVLREIIHEEELPVEGTMSLSALQTDGLEPNEVMARLTGDDSYFGPVFICGAWYKSLTRDQINAFFDWLEEGVIPEETAYYVDAWVNEDVDDYDEWEDNDWDDDDEDNDDWPEEGDDDNWT